MNKIIAFIFLYLGTILEIQCQDITGHWMGLLKVQGIALHIGLNITKNENGYVSTMDSPDQGATGIPISKTSFEDHHLLFSIPGASIEYTGSLSTDSIKGIFKQAGREMPLNFGKVEKAIEKVKRPQDPAEPFPYYTEDVQFENKDAGISLAGTLSMPAKEGKFPAVILISGSGPQNRNEELLNHRPFLVIADYLTRNGIAVLRYDDRGVAKSTGVFKAATSMDFASDAESAMKYLMTRHEINHNQIGLMGHSEGGLIAPILAARNKEVAFIVMLAGPGTKGSILLLKQIELIDRVNQMSEKEIMNEKKLNAKSFDIINKAKNDEEIKEKLTALFKQELKNNPLSKPKDQSEADYVKEKLNETMRLFPWMKFFLKYDPADNLVNVTCPVLAVNGEKDLQVPAIDNLTAIKKLVSKNGNRDVTTTLYPGLNHLFQETKTGNPAEYATIDQTFSPTVLKDVTDWIVKRMLK